jgi:hypothetical protein
VFACLVVKVAGAAWCKAMRTVAGVGDLVQRTGGGRTSWILGGRAVEMCHTWFLRPKPDAHRMYAHDQVVIHMVRM